MTHDAHVPPEQLALIALGEPANTVESEHLSACAACASELAALVDTVRLGRDAASVRLEAPSPAVWDRIRVELGTGGIVQPIRPIPQPEPEEDELGERRPRAARWWITAVAAAACIGLIAALVGGLWFQAAPREPGVVIAQAALQAFPAWPSANGRAEVDDTDGSRELIVHVDGADTAGYTREVWLIAADASRLVSLGVLTGTDGRFPIPAGVNLAEYPLVDVSAEPDGDDDPGHSGDSIVRGELSAPTRS